MDFDKINIDAVSYNVKDATARQQISAETTAREQADSQLSQQIGNVKTSVQEETTAREQADSQLKTDFEEAINAAIKGIANPVTAYGAKGDGVTDDTAAFTAAFAESDVVTVPPGKYIVTGITIPEYKCLIGDSEYESIIKLKDGANGNLITNSGVGSCTISNLYLDGNSGFNTAGNCIYFTGHFFNIFHVQAWNAAENGIKIVGSGIGSLIDGALTRLFACAAKHNKQAGYWLEESDGVMLACAATANSQAQNSLYDGIHCESAFKIVGCHVWGKDNDKGHRYAMYVKNNCNVVDCHIEGGNTNNLFVAGYGNSFTNCMIYALFQDTNANDIWVNGSYNTFSDCVVNSPNGPNNAIGISNNATGICVIGCVLTAYRAINNASSAGGNVFVITGGKGGNTGGGTQVVNYQLANDVYIALGNWDSGKLINKDQW